MAKGCCWDPKTKVKVDRTKLIVAIRQARTAHAVSFRERQAGLRLAHVAYQKELVRAHAAVRKHVAVCMKKAELTHFLKRYGTGREIDYDALFRNGPKMPVQPPPVPEAKELQAAIAAYDLALEQLGMCPVETITITAEDFRKFLVRACP